MKYRILRKNVSKWLRLARMYAMKAEQCYQRNRDTAYYYEWNNAYAMRQFNKYLDLYYNYCQRRNIENEIL